MAGVVQNINPEILKECRQQISIPFDEVIKRVPKILEIESGIKKPTYKQLEILAYLYSVPRWVFIRDTLPEQFRYDRNVPGFRQVKDSSIAIDPYTSSHVKRIMAKLERLRSFILELDEDMDHNINTFFPPSIDEHNIKKTANIIREWLGCSLSDSYSFTEWKERVENKGVFVFLTSKYRSWSHVDRSVFRGLSIYHDTLPIIVINDSDANKAQTFTLFHELAHILRKESFSDGWDSNTGVEQWCDRLAGSVLLPDDLIKEKTGDLVTLKRVAGNFKVSPFAYLVRQRQLNLIDFTLYKKLETELKDEWIIIKKHQQESIGGPARNRPEEIIRQYGRYSRTILQAYVESEISLHKLMGIFELKKADYVSELMSLA